LFGSRADGTYSSNSDFDIFVVTMKTEDVHRIVRKHRLAEMIQLISKTPEQMLIFDKEEPVFRNQIKKGIVLWEQS